MIPMLSCLFCKRKRRLFKIYKIYGRTERPITSYIISFFGDVEQFLKEDHGICSACVFLLNKLIYIKNFMFKAIVEDPANDESPYVTFATAYKLFLHNLDKLNFDDAELLEEETVSDLLKPTHSIPCDSYSETDYDYSSDRNTPYVDQEVEKVFRKARRKRRRRSEIDDDGVSTPLLRYDKDGRLLNKRTRSVSRVLNSMQEDLDTEHKDKFCTCPDCQKKNGRRSLIRENISHHELLAKYWCYECRSGRFTSLKFMMKRQLKRHKKTHLGLKPYTCEICNRGFPTLQNRDRHVKTHTGEKPFSCSTCGKAFLSDGNLKRHIRTHTGEKPYEYDFVHHKAPEEMTTFYRIDYDDQPQNPLAHVSQNATGDFAVKVLMQVEKLSDSPHLQFNQSPDVTSSEGTDLERVSADNLSSESCDGANRSASSSTGRMFTPSTEAEFEDANSVDERTSVGEKDSVPIEDKGSIGEKESMEERGKETDEQEFIPSAFETERIIHDIIESSFESEESDSDVNDDSNAYQERWSPKKELKVVLERLVMDSNQLSSLEMQKQSPTIEYRTRQRSNRSQSTNFLDFESAEKNLLPRRSLSPRKLNNSPSAVSVRSLLRLSGSRASETEAIPVRTDSETDTNNSNC